MPTVASEGRIPCGISGALSSCITAVGADSAPGQGENMVLIDEVSLSFSFVSSSMSRKKQ